MICHRLLNIYPNVQPLVSVPFVTQFEPQLLYSLVVFPAEVGTFKSIYTPKSR